MSIGNRIRGLRTAQGLSQEALARKADLSLNLVHKLERGLVSDPHYSTLVALAGALGMSSVSELLEIPVPLDEAPLSPGPPPSEGLVDAESWTDAVEEMWRLRETSREHLEGTLAAWREGEEHGACYEEQRDQVAEMVKLMNEVRAAKLELGWAYIQAQLKAGGSTGQWAQYLRPELSEAVLFEEALLALIKSTGVPVRKGRHGRLEAAVS